MPYRSRPWPPEYLAISLPSRAVELNWVSWALAFGEASSEAILHIEDDTIRIVSGQPAGFLNFVAWFDADIFLIPHRVERITSAMREELGSRIVPCEWAVLGSQERGPQIESALVCNGWRFAYELPGMTCIFREPLLETCSNCNKFAIERVSTPEQVSEWVDPFVESFCINRHAVPFITAAFETISASMEHSVQCYLLREEGVAIATGTIQFQCGVAVIYNIATAMYARGRGAATTMVEFLKQVAYNHGYHSVSLFAMEAGRGIYSRLGFSDNKASYRVFAQTLRPPPS